MNSTPAPVSVAGNLRCLHQCGYQVREHLSLDNWQALNRLPSLAVEPPHGSPLTPEAALGGYVETLHGDADPWVPEDVARASGRWARDHEFLTVPGAGHFPHQEAPRHVTEVLLRRL